jgi:hypothetical protein
VAEDLATTSSTLHHFLHQKKNIIRFLCFFEKSNSIRHCSEVQNTGSWPPPLAPIRGTRTAVPDPSTAMVEAKKNNIQFFSMLSIIELCAILYAPHYPCTTLVPQHHQFRCHCGSSLSSAGGDGNNAHGRGLLLTTRCTRQCIVITSAMTAWIVRVDLHETWSYQSSPLPTL